MTDKSDAFLFGWAVKHAGHDSRKRAYRWEHVMGLFGLGSTSAQALCRRFGADLDETVGGCSGCGHDALCVQCDAESLGLGEGE